MKKKRLLSVLAAISMLGSCLTGCAGGGMSGASEGSSTGSGQTAESSSEKVVLRLSMNMTLGSKEIVQEVMNEVLKDYPNVELQVEETAQDSYVSKMAMDVSTDNVADLVQYWRPDSTTHGCPKYIEKGVFADLSELLGTDAFKDRFADHAVTTCTVDGKFYAVPMEYSFIMFLANKEILDQCSLPVPETWDELLGSMDVLKENGYIP